MTAPTGLDRYEMLLQAALATGPAARNAYDEWAAVLDLAGPIDSGDMALLPTVVANLQRQGTTPADNDVWRRIRGVTRRLWSSNHVRLSTLARVLATFERLGAQAVVAPGSFTVIAALDNIAAAAIDLVELVVRPTSARRCVAALISLGATTDNDLELLLDDRFAWAGRMYGVLDGCPILLRWDVEDVVFPTSAECTIASTNVRMYGPEQAAASRVQTIVGDQESVAIRLQAVLALHATLTTGVVGVDAAATVAHETGSVVASLDALTWLASISDAGDFNGFTERFTAYRVDPPRPPPQRSRRPSRLLLEEVRAYRLDASRNLRTPNARGLARHVVLHAVRRVRDRSRQN